MVTDAPDEQALSESRSWECSLIRTTNGSNPTLSRDALRVIDRLKAAYGTREAVIDEAVRQLKTRNCRDSRTSREREKSAEAHIWTGLVSAYERVLGGTQKNKTIAEAHVPAIVTDQGRRAPARLRSKSHRK
jgi:hypothetical protein